MSVAVAVLAALIAGYGLGRWQPYDRLAEWANWELRFHLDRWTSRPRQAALFALLLLTDPVGTVRAWRHRHDPPPPKSPPLRFRTDEEPGR
ncbi:hypothetical protein SEA_CUMBERBATCH_52 [Streptomyces phage Cumberbatch]|uniref:Uncharacterized protein n=4 Tax=Ignaciovirus TaxID=3152509 RepID=A0A6M9Z5J3_9CAUD|nr:hypothetical protein QEN61_gp51 [Streptomyces phage Eklok]YP_010756344.1 hypothetical protein QEN63_gp50 [Streptomyces phage Vondra]YP_010756462.1 hypothetical protein QEN65_gp52 [Streptomyces phage Cumberbatch]YP_010756520.1 hypothetical protein QEN66_gp51 [Streptomyces phage Piccadilly]YP_010756578.1 hypothetical protein QEN67_gp51 [Streptomyces phage Eastland]QKN87635.1 hypothetical protein SEA_VONDRA_50 [Streptomyces phage Vondra]QKN87694.1 hypothetical protein SEA_CUMBERBATCH_52 [Stre